MLENAVEEFLVAETKRLRGRAIKLNPAWNIGIPDRLVLLNGRAIFIELKKPKGGRFSLMQLRWKNWLNNNGFEWCHAKTLEEVRDILNEDIKASRESKKEK